VLRRAHDVVLVDRAAIRPDGSATLTGTSVMRFTPDGERADVVGAA
jgi:hypothetical protein